MLGFVIGALVGAFMAVSVLGFMAIVAEDQEQEEQARLQREQDQRRLEELKNHYREYY